MKFSIIFRIILVPAKMLTKIQQKPQILSSFISKELAPASLAPWKGSQPWSIPQGHLGATQKGFASIPALAIWFLPAMQSFALISLSLLFYVPTEKVIPVLSQNGNISFSWASPIPD